MKHSVKVILEPGSTCEGRLDRMIDMIHVAKICGADIVKFQYVSDPAALAKQRGASEYQDAYELICIPEHWIQILSRTCMGEGLEFMCTVYLEKDVEVVAPHVQRWKLSSFESKLMPLRNAMLRTGRPMLMSTGMIDNPVELLDAIPTAQLENIEILHCITNYPTPVDQLQLAVLGNRSLQYSGFSDHSLSTKTGGWAVVAAGIGPDLYPRCRYIEKHVKHWWVGKSNPDAVVSISAKKFIKYIENIREAEDALGNLNERYVCSDEEQWSKYRSGVHES
jgi:N,N'-diacetyllegionaminate synthase